MEKILVIGASGQIGTELTHELRMRHGGAQVVAADLKEPSSDLLSSGPYEKLDVLDNKGLLSLMQKHRFSQVYHMAAILSASGEKNPKLAWDINMNGLLHVLEACREHKIRKLFWPSSIAVFGPTTPRLNTPQQAVMEPVTVYGITKLAGERWCEYYFLKYGLDVRSIRYPGLISHGAAPGGGTTDYAVEIFYHALQSGRYECFLAEDTALPMMYMPDAIRGTIELMDADAGRIRTRSSYNFTSFSLSPSELAKAISAHLPHFQVQYRPDYRQKIAEGWPASIDDSTARKEWGWKPGYDLQAMTKDMLLQIGKRISARV